MDASNKIKFLINNINQPNGHRIKLRFKKCQKISLNLMETVKGTFLILDARTTFRIDFSSLNTQCTINKGSRGDLEPVNLNWDHRKYSFIYSFTFSVNKLLIFPFSRVTSVLMIWSKIALFSQHTQLCTSSFLAHFIIILKCLFLKLTSKIKHLKWKQNKSFWLSFFCRWQSYENKAEEIFIIIPSLIVHSGCGRVYFSCFNLLWCEVIF